MARATIDLNPDRHDELAALIAHHFEAGGEPREAARWSARGAYWAGPQPAPRGAAPLAIGDAARPRSRGGRGSGALAINSRLMLLDYAWRLGMDTRRGSEAGRRGGGDRDEDRRQALAGDAEDGDRGPAGQAPRRRTPWLAAAAEAIELADESGDVHLQVAIRAIAAYPHLITRRLRRLRSEVLDEMIELIDGDRTIGAGILVGSPLAYAYMSKGLALRERARFEEAEELFSESAADRRGGRRSRDRLLGQEQPRLLLVASAGDVEEGLELAPADLESTERLGDIFSRTRRDLQPRRRPAGGR